MCFSSPLTIFNWTIFVCFSCKSHIDWIWNPYHFTYDLQSFYRKPLHWLLSWHICSREKVLPVEGFCHFCWQLATIGCLNLRISDLFHWSVYPILILKPFPCFFIAVVFSMLNDWDIWVFQFCCLNFCWFFRELCNYVDLTFHFLFCKNSS